MSARTQDRLRVAIIGAGASGLATAGLLARDGHDVTVFDQCEQVGGRAGRWEKDGFRFDTGPSWYLMPEVIDHWFRLMGTSAEAELTLTRLDPGYRTFFEGEPAPRDVPVGADRAAALFDTLDPGSGAELTRYLREAGDLYDTALRHFLYDDFSSARFLTHPEVLRRVPRLLSALGRSLAGVTRHRFRDHRQQQILGYPAVFLGTTPYKAPALYQLMSHLDLEQGVLYPQGGFAAFIDAMARLSVAAGAAIVTSARVERILTSPGPGGTTATGIEWTDDAGTTHRHDADLVVGAADLHHLENALLPEALRTHPEKAWRRRDPGPGAFLACLGVRGALPELSHHNLFFSRDWRKDFDWISDSRSPHTVPDPDALPKTTSVYVSKTSASDPGVAPDGGESLFVLVPSPARPEWGRGGVDGNGAAMVEAAVDHVVDQIAAWAGIPDLASRIVVRRTLGPADFEADFNAWRGGALGLAHTLRQSAFFRPGTVSRKVQGLHYAGASVRPGIGLPMCLISAELVLKRVRGERRAGPAVPAPHQASALEAR
ncbi:phytoene desaturase family protein [Arthrobacter woluwensis]|uniref:Phytoene desaturase n=1 Tax=Arthrobacter woluwensis TaxID=156980 RepID=A0A1H4PTH1_9MICC|nr:phytoene desaturase family protein [Arthrobacter woluwensis]SEC10686.1 phytoene desaturase [Arthrobacter woluwensis]